MIAYLKKKIMNKTNIKINYNVETRLDKNDSAYLKALVNYLVLSDITYIVINNHPCKCVHAGNEIVIDLIDGKVKQYKTMRVEI